MKNNEHKSDDINTITKDFDKAVSKRKWSMIRENSVPLIIPPLVVAGGLFAALLGAWDMLPAMGQKIGVMASAGAVAATTAASFIKPLFNKKASPIVNSKDAIAAIDRDIGDENLPARKMADKPAEYGKNGWDKLFELNKKQVWDQWGDDISDQKRKTGFGAYYNNGKSAKALFHGVALSAAMATAVMNGDGALEKFQEAWNYTPPPPPLVYTAWVTPPNGIANAPVYQDSMLRETLDNTSNLPAHEDSILSIVTYDRAGQITVNGRPLTPDISPDLSLNNSDEIIQYTYSVPLESGEINVQIEGHTYNFDITPDNPPNIEILNVSPDDQDPSSLVLEYTITDDFGASGAELNIGVPDENGNTATPLIPSVQLPPVAIPHTDRPDGP